MTEDNVQNSQEIRSLVKKLALPIWSEKGSKSVPKIAYERRMQIVDRVVKPLGLIGAYARAKSLAEVYQVHLRTIYKDFAWIKGNFKIADLKQVKIDVRIARDKSLAYAIQLLNDSITHEEKAKAILVLMSVTQKYREEMEAWGEKEKVPDKVEVKGPIKLQLEIIDGRGDSEDEVGASDESSSKEH